MATNDNKNGGDRNLFVLMLATGKSTAAAGRISRVPRSTAYRLARNPKVKRRVQQIRHETLARAAGQLSDGAVEASTALRRLLRSNNEAIVLGAARTLLQATLRIREAIEIESRIEQLEQKMSFEGAKRQLRAAYEQVEAEQIEGGSNGDA